MSLKSQIVGCDGTDVKYPEVEVALINFTNQEIQLSQGLTLHFDENAKMDVVSMSLEQAVKVAKQILEFAGE